MNRRRRAKQLRRNILRAGGVITKTKVIKSLPGVGAIPRKEWGYAIDVLANGYTITACDDNWYNCWKSAWKCTKVAFEMETFVKQELVF